MVDFHPMPYSVAGKAALVTGAGSGINLEFARLLVTRGCRVLIADLMLRPEAQEFVDSTSGAAVFHRTDVMDWAQLEGALAACLAHFGQLDIVCPGAGVFEPLWSNFWEPPGTPLSLDTRYANSYKTLDINLTHPIRLQQLALSHFMVHRVPGRIIHISSIAAQGPSPLHPIYCASKAAISALVRSFAAFEPFCGVRVNAVAPGVVQTPLWTDPAHADKLRYVDERHDRWVTPGEVSEAMLGLLEDPDLPGGTILEVGAGSTRKVSLLHDPGPSKTAPGLGVSNAKESWNELTSRLRQGDWGILAPSDGSRTHIARGQASEKNPI